MKSASIEFGRLDDVPARDAWHHEALALTPWLAANLERLEKVLGMKLELEGTELKVESFSADILARDLSTGGRVLIENQLEQSDHVHLGQIMTYLAGLQAETMVWIAPSFREPHLSAIRWLNEHTVEPFAFFAVKLRVVRIADSPYAPLFEVVEKPNAWDRQVQEKAREAVGLSEFGQKRLAFWSHFVDRYPPQAITYPANAASTRWRAVEGSPIDIVQYLGSESVGVYIRASKGHSPGDALALLDSHRDQLESSIGRPLGGSNGYFLGSKLSLDTDNRGNWDQAADWLASQADKYQEILHAVLRKPEGNQE
ncbi:hypothetical protein [Sinorhizobium fredii]|uniref:hypothetical protein n=1 Tax=Rhizobium fredii TaxID=380 RepID=UPI00069467A2|nr:hypothetical protein [Sinorhizobium fredii]WOS65832.1 hypothetical protein SFGR64A_18940 [Sinorhizobium fredii GR64]